jgi:multiple sugar transport system permease protein
MPEEKRSIILFTAPSIFLLAIFSAFPIFYTFFLSFTKFDFTHLELNGLSNYIKLFYDKTFLQVLLNTTIFTGIGVTLNFFISLGIAILLNEKIKFRGVFRALILLPWVMPSVVAATVWGNLFYNPTHGVINYYLTLFGLIKSPIIWLGDPNAVLIACIIVALWKAIPWYSVCLLAGLQSIPEVLYEAAKIDGAGKVERFIHITLPQLSPIIIVVLSLGVIWRWNNFDIIQLMTGGGPAFASSIIVPYIYLQTFGFFDAGYGSAISIFSVMILLIIIFILTRQMRREL